MILREEPFRPITSIVRGTGRAWVPPKLCRPSSPSAMATHPAAQVHAHAQARGAGTDRHRLSQARIRRTVGPVKGGRQTPAPWKQDSRAQPSPNRVGRRFPRPSEGPTKIVKSTVAQDRKELLPVKKAALRYGLEPHVSHPVRFWAWRGGKPTEYATCRQGDSLGWLHRSGVATALQCTPATVLFFMQVRLPKPPLHPSPRSAATSRTVQTPKLAKS